MKYAITLVAEIAKRNAWTGTRRRECTFADGSKQVLVFSRKPVLLDELPPEISKDTKLEVREVPDVVATIDEGILDLEAPTAPAPNASGKFSKGPKKGDK